MLNKQLIQILLFISLLLVMVSCSSNKNNPQVSEPYKIGAILAMTGPGANLGIPMADGMKLAVKEVNDQGGVNGHKIELIIQDSKFDSKASAAAANYLTEVENISIGSVLLGLPFDTVNPIFQQSQTPFIYEAYSRDSLNNSYAFKANFDSLEGCKRLIQYAKQNNKYNRLGVLLSKMPYSDLCLDGIKKVEPNVKEYRYTFGEKDFKTFLTQINNEKVDKLMFLGIDFENVSMFKQLTELGFPIKIICAISSECIFPDVIANSSAGVLESTLSIDFISPNVSELPIAEKLRQEHGDDLKFVDYAYGAIGYEEVQIMAGAFESCQPGDRECIRQALENVKDYNSVIGSHGFKDRVLQLDYQIYEWQDGEWKGVE